MAAGYPAPEPVRRRAGRDRRAGGAGRLRGVPGPRAGADQGPEASRGRRAARVARGQLCVRGHPLDDGLRAQGDQGPAGRDPGTARRPRRGPGTPAAGRTGGPRLRGDLGGAAPAGRGPIRSEQSGRDLMARLRGPFADPRFRRLLAGQSLSSFGDTALYLTLGIWAKALTGSNAAAGGVFLALGIPALFAPAAGHLADRVRRLPLLIGAN